MGRREKRYVVLVPISDDPPPDGFLAQIGLEKLEMAMGGKGS